MKKANSSPLKEQFIIGLGDYHDKDHPANKDQRSYLELILKKSLARVKLIVEDLSSVNNDGNGMCCNYAISTRGGVLGKLADFARAYLIDVDNVEYRFCRVVAVGPLLNSASIAKNSTSGAAININELYKEVVDELEKIRKYDDGSMANALYKRIIADVNKAFGQLKLDHIRNISIGEYCSRLSKNNYIKNLERLCVFDSPLIDLKILHSIVSCQDKPIIIVAAGGSHIEKMNSFLQSIGYQKVAIPSTSAHIQQNVYNMLASGKRKNSSNRYNKPSAINLDVLEHFLFSNEIMQKDSANN